MRRLGVVGVKDLGVGRLRRELGNMAGQHVLVGVLGDRARAQHPHAKVPVGQVAAWLEFGTRNADGSERQPERPALRRMLSEKGPELKAAGRRSIADVIDGRASSAADALAGLAERAEKAYAESFDSMNSWAAPLAESTVAKKGHDTIGVDHGIVRAAIAGKVLPK